MEGSHARRSEYLELLSLWQQELVTPTAGPASWSSNGHDQGRNDEPPSGEDACGIEKFAASCTGRHSSDLVHALGSDTRPMLAITHAVRPAARIHANYKRQNS